MDLCLGLSNVQRKGRGTRKDVDFYDLSFDLVYDPMEMGNRTEEEDLCC